jgi:flagellar biosynthesis protein FlgN
MTALLSLLQKIQLHSQQLLDCLKQEKLVLDGNQLDKLNDISSNKQILLDQLEQLDKQRAANSTNENFNNFIARSNDKTLIHQWQLTRQSIIDCQQQNEINGRLLNKCSQINHDILSIFSGRNQQADETYDATGNQTGNASLFNGVKA